MEVKEEIKVTTFKKIVMQISSQPIDTEVMKLKKNLIQIATSYDTNIAGRRYGHFGLLLEDVDYQMISHSGAAFTCPTHPGMYTTGVPADDTAW